MRREGSSSAPGGDTSPVCKENADYADNDTDCADKKRIVGSLFLFLVISEIRKQSA
jgi:hypothetical protein